MRGKYEDPNIIGSVRGYVRRGNEIVRFLAYTNYEHCYYDGFSREFLFRLPLDDPRTIGSHWQGADYAFDWFNALPFHVWIEIEAKEAAS